VAARRPRAHWRSKRERDHVTGEIELAVELECRALRLCPIEDGYAVVIQNGPGTSQGMGDDELFSLVRNGKPMAPGTPSCQSLTWPMPKHRP
jgi:hypothetical protein